MLKLIPPEAPEAQRGIPGAVSYARQLAQRESRVSSVMTFGPIDSVDAVCGNADYLAHSSPKLAPRRNISAYC
jgi:hypothetical protein